jgi:cytochrome P450 PksS
MEDQTMATTARQETPVAPTGATSPGTANTDELTEINITDPHFMATAYDTYDELRDEGPVARVRFRTGRETDETNTPRDRFFNSEAYFVTGYDEVVATLFDDRFVVDPRSLMSAEERAQAPEPPEEFRPLARSLLNIDPPDHTRIRKLVQPSFTGRGMEAMRPGIQQIVDNMLGIPRQDRQQIRGWTQNLLRVDRANDPAAQEEVRAGLREFSAYLTDLFARKRQAPTDDMISRMVHIQEDDDVLTEEEMLATVFLMYLAGHVTTVNLVGNGVVALLSHPEQLAKMQADPSLAKNMVEETLRYWGPVDFIARRLAKEDLEIAGTPIARGDHVTVGLASANRDPERFAHPDAYDITREEANRHVAFGKGIHVCLGAPLARVEGQVAFETLMRRYPALRLAVPAEEIAWGGSFLRGFRQVPLLF